MAVRPLIIRRAALVVAGFVLATSAGAGPALAQSVVAKLAQCTVNLQASSLSLNTGQDLILTWTSVGAGRLMANWSSTPLPLAGAVTTSKSSAGTYTYHVTGSKGGKY